MLQRLLACGLTLLLGVSAVAVQAQTTPVKQKHKAVAKTKAITPPSAPVVEADPDEDQIAVAERVYTGRMVCELGNQVQVTADPQRAATFEVQLRKTTYRMTPVATSTGAVRLEDAKSGALWLQLVNKSMLIDTKLGQRLADECQNSAQVAVAERLKNNPVPGLLDDPSVARK